MVYKRYIYRDGKRFGPYYYHTYRDKEGRTHSRYVNHPDHTRAVTAHNNSTKKFFGRPMIFVLLLAIVAIFLGVAYLNYALQDPQIDSSKQDATFFESLSKSVYGFFTGFTTEEGTDVESSSSSDEENSEIVDSTEATEESRASEPDSETPVETIPEENTEEVLPEEIDVTSEENNVSGELNETDETFPENQTEENETVVVEINETVDETVSEEEPIEEGQEGESISNETANYTIGNETNQTNFTLDESNESFINKTVENVTIETNATNMSAEISTKQFGAVLGQPVKWEKNVKVNIEGAETATNLKIDLPEKAGNVSVKKKTEFGEEEVNVNVENEIEIEESDTVVEEKLETSSSGIFNFILGLFRFTGRVTDGGDVQNVVVEVNEEVKDDDELIVEYYTQAPYAVETESVNGKEVRIVGPESVHYENVLVFTELDDKLGVRVPGSVTIYWKENNTFISPTSLSDTDFNGIYDYIEWIVPHLSNQTFEIIVITKAEHMDSERNFISDIYEEVHKLDDVWSENISDGEYVRVTFERNLTSLNDITVYPRIIGGEPRIEVYEFNGTELIAEFENLIGDERNRVYLGNLVGEQDTFDLLILDGSVEFDLIIDPTLLIGNVTTLCGEITDYDTIHVNGSGTLQICDRDLFGSNSGYVNISLGSNGNFTVDSGGKVLGAFNGGLGGAGRTGTGLAAQQGMDGETFVGGGNSVNPNGGGGGGGIRSSANEAASGAGGGFGGAGGKGGNTTATGTTQKGGLGGGTYLSEDDEDLRIGSGGGGGNGDVARTGGDGGGGFKVDVGGGIINIKGTINVSGANGAGGTTTDEGSAGGGSGGHIILSAGSIDLDSATLIANGGNGGSATGLGDKCGGGGAGGGRIVLVYGSLSNTSVTVTASAGSAGSSNGCDTLPSGGSTGTIYYEEVASPPTWSENSTNSTVRGTAVEHRVYWIDNSALSGYIFSFDNGTGSFTNDSWVGLSGTFNWSNVTKVINSTNGTTIQWKFYANDSSDAWNVTSEFSYVANSSIPTHDAPSVTPYPIALSTQNLTCVNQSTVDIDGDSVINIYNWLIDGDSLTLLNLAFDTNISTTTADAVRDYSGLGNNATLGNSTGDMIPTWTVNPGVMRGGYDFSGGEKTIRVPNSASLNSDVGKNFTISFWYNDTSTSSQYLFTKGSHADGFGVYLDSLNRFWVVKDGGGLGLSGVSSQDSMNQYVVSCNETNCAVYVNGAIDFSTTGINDTNNEDIHIGSNNDSATNGAQGIFADFKIFNRTLSATEVSQLYVDENLVMQANSTILGSMTASGENWTCQVTPNDAAFDGETKENSTLVVSSDLPNVALISPTDASTYYSDVNVTFICNASDDLDIVNVSLYGNWSGDWTFNASVDVSGNSNTTYLAGFNVSGIDAGTYSWNCLVYDNDSQSNWNSTNFTFTHDPCSVTQISSSTTLTADDCGYYNITADDVVFDCADYNIFGLNDFDYWGIEATGRDNVTIQNCDMEKYAKVILFNSTSNSQLLNLTIYNNSFVNETSVTAYGLYFFNSYNNSFWNSNLTKLWTNSTTSGCYSGGVYAVYLENSNNTFINNTVFDDIEGQIYKDGSDLLGCQATLSDIGYGIYIPSLVDNTTILNSNFSNLAQVGIYSSGSTNLTLNDSTMTFVDSGSGIYIYGGGDVFINGNNVSFLSTDFLNSITTLDGILVINDNSISSLSTGSDGINILGEVSGGVQIMGNTFYNLSGTYIKTNSHNTIIHNNVLTGVNGFEGNGIEVALGRTGISLYNNTLNNLVITFADYAAISLGSAPDLFSDIFITNGTQCVAIYGGNIDFWNSTITNCTNGDFVVYGGNVSLYNVAFNQSNALFGSPGVGYLNQYHLFRGNITNQNYDPVTSAAINISDSHGVKVLSDSSSVATGLTPWTWVREYEQRGSATYAVGCVGSGSYINCSTPHNVTAFKTGYSTDSRDVTINETKTETFMIQTPYIAAYIPVTDTFSIAEASNQTFSIITSNTTPVTIRWFVEDSEQVGSINNTQFIWVGNYSQEGTYAIKVNISNEVGVDEQSWTMTVNDTFAQVSINWTYPTSNINVSKHSFFNITLNVTCIQADCGTVNVSLFANNSLVNVTEGAIPFYTNSSINPQTTSLLNLSNSELVNFWVNATGTINEIYGFVATANLTSNLSLNNITDVRNVTITEEAFSVSIELSPLLAQQINWTLLSLPAVEISAPGNDGNEYYINISVSGGTADLYMKASGNLTTPGGDVLGLGNETYDNTTDTGVWPGTKTPLTTNFSDNKIGSALSSGNTTFLRFYLSAPSGQAAGTYNNTLYFKAVKTGETP